MSAVPASENQNRTDKTGQAERYRQNMTRQAGRTEKQNRTRRKRWAEQDGRTEQQNRTCRTGKT
jgi:hypothetical protein